MKILVVTDSYPPHHSGGYELRCRDVLNGLMERGHEVAIISTRCPTEHCNLHPDEMNIQRILHRKVDEKSLLKRIVNDASDLRQVDKRMKTFQPDLIYLWHLVNLSDAILPYFSRYNLPVVYDEGGNGLANFVKKAAGPVYFHKNENDTPFRKRAKSILSTIIQKLSLNLINNVWIFPHQLSANFNNQYSLTLAREKGVPLKHAAVTPSGVNTSRFFYRAHAQVNSPVKILVPGRIVKIKGTMDALDLLGALINRGISTQLTIVGEIFSRQYYQELVSAISDQGMTEYITIQPMLSQDDLVRLYHQADICFFPSYQPYGLSRIPLEAMACGCPVISYGNEGSGEIIYNQQTGFIVPESGISATVDVIETIMAQPDKLKTITTAARHVIEQKYAMEQYIDSVEAFLLKSWA